MDTKDNFIQTVHKYIFVIKMYPTYSFICHFEYPKKYFEDCFLPSDIYKIDYDKLLKWIVKPKVWYLLGKYVYFFRV